MKGENLEPTQQEFPNLRMSLRYEMRRLQGLPSPQTHKSMSLNIEQPNTLPSRIGYVEEQYERSHKTFLMWRDASFPRSAR